MQLSYFGLICDPHSLKKSNLEMPEALKKMMFFLGIQFLLLLPIWILHVL